MRYNEIEVEPTIPPRTIAKAQMNGFDTSKIWYHGSDKNIHNFRKPQRVGELGVGIYLTSIKLFANTWARDGGHIMLCFVKHGEMIHLDSLRDPRSKLIRDAYRRHCALMRRMWGEDTAVWSFNSFVEYATTKGLSNGVLGKMGYIGGYSDHGQIPGQIVVFDRSSVFVAGRLPGE